jgi:hypothetical protein
LRYVGQEYYTDGPQCVLNHDRHSPRYEAKRREVVEKTDQLGIDVATVHKEFFQVLKRNLEI